MSDSQSRAAYDAGGMNDLNSPNGMPGMNDAFAQFFAGGPSFGFDFGPGRRRGKGDDTVINYDVALEELYNGKSVKMNMEKEVVCIVCKG